MEDAVTGMNVTSLTSALTLTAFQSVIESLLPIVATAVLVGFLFYVVRWAIGLFRGIQPKAGAFPRGPLLRIFMQELAQVTIDVLAWFLQPFSVVLAVYWVVSLFRKN